MKQVIRYFQKLWVHYNFTSIDKIILFPLQCFLVVTLFKCTDNRTALFVMRKNPMRILVRCPNWVGDVVMATPFLDALRNAFPDAHITYMLRNYVRQVYSGSPWCNEFFVIENKQKKLSFVEKIAQVIKHIRYMRKGNYDTAVLLVNSFQSAFEVWCAGISLRLGYKREGRGLFLTEGPTPNIKNGVYIPGPMIPYYNKLAEFLNIMPPSLDMKLYVSTHEDSEADARLQHMGVLPSDKLVGLNPGGAFGASKFWSPAYYAAVGDYYSSFERVKVIIFAGPNEEQIANDIAGLMKQPAVISTSDKLSLGGAKAVYKRLNLLVTNDTGPRHFASAFGVPSVVLIGSTNPKWTENHDPYQFVLGKIPVCGPCHQRICPLNHQCMKALKPTQVIEIANKLLEKKYGKDFFSTSKSVE